MVDTSENRPSGRSWHAFATGESKNAIVLWLLAGWGNNIIVEELLSLSSVLLLVPGIFLASVVSIPSALFNAMKARHLTEIKQGIRRRKVLELVGWTTWSVVDLAYVPILAILFASLINSWWE